MDFGQAPYEVEIRYRFKDTIEAYTMIPFLDSCLHIRKSWKSQLFGEEIFHSGKLLRIGIMSPDDNPVHYLCMKGTDIGTFANIRQETEEIITYGIQDSTILKTLGGKTNATSYKEVEAELERLGHLPFMSFDGTDIFGDYDPYGISVKLMLCPHIRFPLLVEFEKLAETEEQARLFKEDLKKITDELDLRDHLVREEPPTLRYQQLFGTEKL